MHRTGALRLLPFDVLAGVASLHAILGRGRVAR